MRRYFYTTFSMYLCAVLATFFLSYPQAASLDAPDRGWLATTLTLTAFFSSGLLPIIAIAAVVSLLLRRLFRVVFRVAAPAFGFFIGCASVATVLAITTYGNNPTDVIALVTAWILSGGVGEFSVGDGADTPARIQWRHWTIGTFAVVTAGLVALVIERAAWAL